MKKYLLIIVVMLLLGAIGFFVYLNSANDNFSNNIEINDSVDNVGNENIKENQLPEISDLTFSEAVNEIFIGYSDNDYSGKIISFNQESLPNEPHTYAIHQGNPYVLISFNNKLSEEKQNRLMEEINIESNEDIKIDIRKNYTQYKIDVSDFKESVTYYFGDLAPITIERKEPLGLKIEDNEGIINYQNEYIFLLLVPEEKDSLILTFSEKMNQNVQLLADNNVPVGEWIDEYNYRINLTDLSGVLPGIFTPYNGFREFFSINGNYLKNYDDPIMIARVKNSKWVDYKTGHELTWGKEYQRYYDKIIFSPDNQSYIGIIDNVINTFLQPERGRSYSFILHEKGKEPYILEELFHDRDRFMGYPIFWLNNEEVLYGNKIFNIKTKESKEIISYEGVDRRIQQFAYDSYDGKLYLLVFYFQGVNYKEYYVDRWIFNTLDSEPIIEKHFSGILYEYFGYAENLTIEVVKNGIYWTRVEGDIPKVVYEGRDGYTEEREGRILFANDKGVVVWKDKKSHDLIWWEIGKEDETIPYKDNMQPFGDDFVYFNTEEKQYYRFDPEKGSWVKADYPSNAYLPAQEVNQYYKK